MSLAKYANKRDENEPEIIEALIRAGATVCPLDKPCDLIVGYQGKNKLFELKVRGGKLTPQQLEFQKVWEGQYAVIWSIEDALSELEDMR